MLGMIVELIRYEARFYTDSL